MRLRYFERLLVLVFVSGYLTLLPAAPSRDLREDDLVDAVEATSTNRGNSNPERPDDIPESELFEGDLMGVDKAAFSGSDEGSEGFMQANAVNKEELKWPDGKVVYEISRNYNKKQRLLILDAMNNIQENTCISFRKKTESDEDFILVRPGLGNCASFPGRTGGLQSVVLSGGCMSAGTILHEIMHSIGFYHEHTRTDRDEFVEINEANIAPGNEINFRKYNGNTFGLPYDYGSVLHYKENAFAIDEKSWTIRPKPPNENTPTGQREALSKWDVQKINTLYQCPQATTRVCGYLWTDSKFSGMMTVIYEKALDSESSHYGRNKRHYASAEILPGCQVFYYTEEDPGGVTLIPQKYRSFQKKHQSSARQLACECSKNER